MFFTLRNHWFFFKSCSLGNQKWLFYGITARTFILESLFLRVYTDTQPREYRQKQKDKCNFWFFTVYTNDINRHDDVLAHTLHIPKNVLAALEYNNTLNQAPFVNK